MSKRQYRRLEAELDEMERTDPRIGVARKHLDETIDRIVMRADLEPEIEKAKRQAILDLIHEKYASCDQKGLDSMIITAQFRGYQLTEADLVAQLKRCTDEVQQWWLEPCDIH